MDAWRAFPWSDPDLPAELLPEAWPRTEARELLVRLYDGLADGRHCLRRGNRGQGSARTGGHGAGHLSVTVRQLLSPNGSSGRPPAFADAG